MAEWCLAGNAAVVMLWAMSPLVWMARRAWRQRSVVPASLHRATIDGRPVVRVGESGSRWADEATGVYLDPLDNEAVDHAAVWHTINEPLRRRGQLSIVDNRGGEVGVPDAEGGVHPEVIG